MQLCEKLDALPFSVSEKLYVYIYIKSRDSSYEKTCLYCCFVYVQEDLNAPCLTAELGIMF